MGCVLEGAAGVQALQQQRTRTGVIGQQPDRPVALPEGEGMRFHQGFLVRIGDLQDGCFPGAGPPGAGFGAHRDHDGAVAVPGQGAGSEVKLELPPLQAAA